MILILAACKSSTSQFDSLPQADRDYIQQQGQAACRAQYAAAYQRYKDNTDVHWGVEDGYQRGSGFHQEYLDGTSVQSKIDFKVWKTDDTDIYFYVTETLSLTTNSYFLKLNRVTNATIIDDLAEDDCTKKYTDATISTSGPMTITSEYVVTNTLNANHFDHYQVVYTLDLNKPAYLGPFKLSNKLTTTDRFESGGNTIGSSKTLTTTFVAQNYTFSVDGNGNEVQYNAVIPASSPTATYYTQNFCEPADTTSTGNFRLTVSPATSSPSTIFRFGFNYTCVPTTAPGTWNLAI
jgi:hypothetical protein